MNKNSTLAIFYILLVVLTRTIFHVAPNVEFVTAISIGSAMFFRKQGLGILISALLISDFIIGNSIIFLFTWSGFIASFGIAKFLKHNKDDFIGGLVKSQSAGILGTLIFFLWTNFGVVVTSSMYSKNLEGLLQSYVNALPFLNNQLIGNLFIVPLVYVGTYFFVKYAKTGQFSFKLSKAD